MLISRKRMSLAALATSVALSSCMLVPALATEGSTTDAPTDVPLTQATAPAVTDTEPESASAMSAQEDPSTSEDASSADNDVPTSGPSAADSGIENLESAENEALSEASDVDSSIEQDGSSSASSVGNASPENATPPDTTPLDSE